MASTQIIDGDESSVFGDYNPGCYGYLFWRDGADLFLYRLVLEPARDYFSDDGTIFLGDGYD